jgi:hypothetical protein
MPNAKISNCAKKTSSIFFPRASAFICLACGEICGLESQQKYKARQDQQYSNKNTMLIRLDLLLPFRAAQFASLVHEKDKKSHAEDEQH